MVTRAVIKHSRFWVVRIIFVALYFVIAFPMSYADDTYTVTISSDSSDGSYDGYSGYVFCVDSHDADVTVNGSGVENFCDDTAVSYYFIDISTDPSNEDGSYATLEFSSPISLKVFYSSDPGSSTPDPDMYLHFGVLEVDADSGSNAGFYCMQDIINTKNNINNFSLGYQLDGISFRCMNYSDSADTVNADGNELPNEINPASFIPISNSSESVSLQTFLTGGLPCCTTGVLGGSYIPYTETEEVVEKYYLHANSDCSTTNDYFKNCGYNKYNSSDVNQCKVQTCTSENGCETSSEMSYIPCYSNQTIIDSVSGYYQCTYDDEKESCTLSETPVCIDCSADKYTDYYNTNDSPPYPLEHCASYGDYNMICTVNKSGDQYVFTDSSCNTSSSQANVNTACVTSGDEYPVFSSTTLTDVRSDSAISQLPYGKVFYRCDHYSGSNECTTSTNTADQYMW